MSKKKKCPNCHQRLKLCKCSYKKKQQRLNKIFSPFYNEKDYDHVLKKIAEKTYNE